MVKINCKIKERNRLDLFLKGLEAFDTTKISITNFEVKYDELSFNGVDYLLDNQFTIIYRNDDTKPQDAVESFKFKQYVESFLLQTKSYI